MIDMSKTITPKSDQLNADDLIGGPRTIRITRITGDENAETQPVSIYFEGDNNKPYKPALSMRRVMVMVWGNDASEYIGRSMTLYSDPTVMFGGIKVGGIRISHMSHIAQAQSLMLTKTRGKKSEYRVMPLAQGADEELLINARAAADDGTEAYQSFFVDLSPQQKRALADSGDHERLKKVAADATEAAKPLAQKLAEQSDPKPAPHWTDDLDPGAGFPGSEAFAAGEKAAADGLTVKDCPHEDDMEAAQDWLAGFMGAAK